MSNQNENLDSASAVTKAILGRDEGLANIYQNFRAKLESKFKIWAALPRYLKKFVIGTSTVLNSQTYVCLIF